MPVWLEAVKTICALAVLAAALFGGTVVLRRLAGGGERPVYPFPGRRQLLRAAGACLLAGAGYQAVFWAAALAQAPGETPAAALERFFAANIDARHYIDLAQHGYGAGEAFPEQYLMIVFFPLFPALLRLANLTGALDWYILATAVQLPIFAAAGAGLYALAARHYGRSCAGWALAFLLVSPGSFFFFAPMTESLFLLLCVGYVLTLEQRRFAVCGALGLLAGLARAPGALLAGLAAVWAAAEYLPQKKRPPAGVLLAVGGPAAGLASYFCLNIAVYGRWDQFSVYQWEHWNQKMTPFFDTVRYLLDYAYSWWTDQRQTAVFLSLTGALCVLVQFLLLAAGARRLKVHHAAFGLAYAAFTTGVSWLLSAPRYAAALFCLPIALALVVRRRAARWLTHAALAGCGVVYLWVFLRHGPIY